MDTQERQIEGNSPVLEARYKEARRIGYQMLMNVVERDAGWLHPSFPSTALDIDMHEAVGSGSYGPITEEDIGNKQWASLMLVLETAARLVNGLITPRHTDYIRESGGSLERLLALLEESLQAHMPLLTGEHIAEQVKFLLAHLDIHPLGEEPTDEALKTWALEQYKVAIEKIKKRLELVKPLSEDNISFQAVEKVNPSSDTTPA